MSNTIRMMPVLAGLLALSSAPAQAIDYPYCLTYVEGWSGAIERCDFSTLAQCQASSAGLGGSCAPNWRLAQHRGYSPDRIEPGPAGTRIRR